jgi:hypothetical protein
MSCFSCLQFGLSFASSTKDSYTELIDTYSFTTPIIEKPTVDPITPVLTPQAEIDATLVDILPLCTSGGVPKYHPCMFITRPKHPIGVPTVLCDSLIDICSYVSVFDVSYILDRLSLESSRENTFANDHDIPLIERLAVYAFTIEITGKSSGKWQVQLYGVLNRALREQHCVSHLRPYLELLDAGMHRIPPQVGTMYRGVDASMLTVLRNNYVHNGYVTWQSFSSTSSDRSVSTRFAKRGSGALLILKILSGRDISGMSAFRKEAEFLLPHETHFIVRQSITGNAGVPTIVLEEVVGPVPTTTFRT